MRMRKLLSGILCLALVIGLLPGMTLNADAASCSSYYFDMTDRDVMVGDEVRLKPSAYTADLATSDYGVKNDYRYKFEDPSMVQIKDGSAVFLKAGKVYLTVTHDQYFERTGKSQSHTHSIVFTVNARKEINPKEITVYSGDFNGGDVFPGFSVSSTAGYVIEEVSFYHEMCDYYPGDKIPFFRSGTEIDNICLKLKPKEGYMFAFSGEADGTKEKSAYSISYRGKTYAADVKKDYADNSLTAYLSGTVAKGQIYHATIKDLNLPYHNSSLDKDITVPDYLEPVSVRYTMFGKDLDRLEKGDRIGIIVRLKTKNEKDSFAPSGSIYWDELKKIQHVHKDHQQQRSRIYF